MLISRDAKTLIGAQQGCERTQGQIGALMFKLMQIYSKLFRLIF
jgi:hypothetical protein